MRTNWSDDFEKLYKERGQQKHGIRLLALWKIQRGFSEESVCHFIGKTHKTLRTWRRLYEKEGLEALLKIRSGRGCKARITNQEAFERDIEELQKHRQGGRIRCADVVNFMAEKYDIHYTLSGMYNVLHRFGFSWITSRSKHPKQNPQKIEAFKKTL